MTDANFYNSLSKKKEIIDRTTDIKIYSCGPTVYEKQHIGNMRYFVFVDTLARTLRENGYKVKHVMNLTDVGHLVGDGDEGEDKIEKSAKEKGKSYKEIVRWSIEIFYRYLGWLNIDKDNFIWTQASDYIQQQQDLLKKIEDKGATYKTSYGIYFDTSKYEEYGKLGNIDIKNLQDGHRIIKNQEKRNNTDFALWRFPASNEKRQQEWDSPWGVGFPGWHLECSAMAKAKLGDTIDIHTGGIDNMPTHHNNEIAQSETAYGKQYVKVWMHCEHLNLNNEKLSKSIGNTITLDDLWEKKYNANTLRYLFLTSHYRKQANFTYEALDASQNAIEKIQKLCNKFTETDIYHSGNWTSRTEVNLNYLVDIETIKKIEGYMLDDLNTPKAIACMWDMINDKSLEEKIKVSTIIKKLNKYFGLIFHFKEINLDDFETPSKDIVELAEKRQKARKNGDYELSDKLRKDIKEKGWSVIDVDNEKKGYELVINRED